MKVEGRCHCGAIQYEAEVQLGTVVVCHCADCQMQSGSAFRANIPAPAHTFRLLRGVPKRYIKVAPSGARRIHAFCENCGGPIYSSAEVDPTHYSLRVGALKQRFELGA
ncbi:GFA family protein, partial [Caballeronia sp. ATUFL_M2_KS44]|uniref:GFA family protein n=1 Tax=Caballeronia sp. ATUFL_M2_KS44 TaxID=2921767 RepID=UPI002027E50B